MPDDVTIGIVTALTIEHAAVRKVLDGPREERKPGDRKGYCLGIIPSADSTRPHQVAAVQQTRDGTHIAAGTVTGLLRSFPSVRFILMCGIAAGAPTAGVRLGDIVSATKGIVDYGHVVATDEGQAVRRTPGDVSAALLDADNHLAGGEIDGQRPWLATLAALERDNVDFRRPPSPGTPVVHRGVIGSSNVLHRSAELRDSLVRQHRILALEMEASGVAEAARDLGREFFVVRGISDLADRDKDDRWQGYAAAEAASYLRALLQVLAPVGAPSRAGAGGRIASLARIVDALLNSRSVWDEHARLLLLDHLPIHIRTGIAYSPKPRSHVLSIVGTCQNYPGGLDALLDALSLVIGAESPEFLTLEKIIRENWGHA